MLAELIGSLDANNGVGEGPTWDEQAGLLWWTDIPRHRVLRLTLATMRIDQWEVRDFPAFTALAASGGLVIGTRDRILRFDPSSGGTSVLARLEPDRPGNRANEGKVDPLGRLWVGTMQNNLNPDSSRKEMTGAFGGLYRVAPDGRFVRVLDGIGLSNTLAWADGGHTMYFGDTRVNRIRRYRLDDAGNVIADEPFHTATPAGHGDGSAIDAAGYLWNCRFGGNRIVRFAPDGSIDAEIMLPVANPTSCAFGGADFRTLFVTSARAQLTGPGEGALVILRTSVPGLPATRFG